MSAFGLRDDVAHVKSLSRNSLTGVQPERNEGISWIIRDDYDCHIPSIPSLAGSHEQLWVASGHCALQLPPLFKDVSMFSRGRNFITEKSSTKCSRLGV
jgi:hypothetical protein